MAMDARTERDRMIAGQVHRATDFELVAEPDVIRAFIDIERRFRGASGAP